MTVEREALRDWHRLFGLLLTDFFSGSPFAVEVERDLSIQQQLLDVTIVRRGRGRFAGRLPDGLDVWSWPENCRKRRTMPRCTCSAPRRTWLTSAVAPTSAGRSRRV